MSEASAVEASPKPQVRKEFRLRGPFRTLLCGLAVITLIAGFFSITAAASSVGGLRPAALHAQTYLAGAVVDSFTAPAGTNLSTRTDACGNPWRTSGGTFTINSNGTARSTGGALVTTSVPLCNGGTNPNEEVGGDIHSSGSSLFGLLLHSQPGGRASTAALYSNSGAGTLYIQRIAADGTVTVWASVTGTGGGNTPRFLRFSYINGVYQVSVNNVLALTYSVTATQRTVVEANNEVGMVAVDDIRSTFDNLQSYPR